MSKNSSVIVPYDAELQAGLILFTGNTSYDGTTGTFVSFAATSKLRRLFSIHLQARGTNVATLLRFHLLDSIGGAAPLCRDIRVPATTASTTQPLWSRTLYFRGVVIPSGAFIRAQTVSTIVAGISVLPMIQVLET